jgi:predicted nicotinamide N-methyase
VSDDPVFPRPASEILAHQEAAVAFIREHTTPGRPPFVPELLLRVAAELTPVWEQTEAVAASPQPPPFWAFPWVGGQALARFVLDRPEVVRGRRVLDFATGSGLVALAARRAGAATVLAVDIDPLAVAAAAVNAAANQAEIDLVVGDPVGTRPDVDVVLAGDVCYEGSSAPRIADWLRALAAADRLVLIGDGGRAFLPREGLELLVRHEIPTTREIESDERRQAAVWRVLPH